MLRGVSDVKKLDVLTVLAGSDRKNIILVTLRSFHFHFLQTRDLERTSVNCLLSTHHLQILFSDIWCC